MNNKIQISAEGIKKLQFPNNSAICTLCQTWFQDQKKSFEINDFEIKIRLLRQVLLELSKKLCDRKNVAQKKGLNFHEKVIFGKKIKLQVENPDDDHLINLSLLKKLIRHSIKNELAIKIVR